MVALIAVLVVGVASLGVHSGASKPGVRTVAVSTQRVTIDGHTRDVTVVSPQRLDGALLVALPGLTETTAALRAASDADSLAFAEGVTIAYLGGYDNSWNAGSCCGDAVKDKVDDVATIRSVSRAIVTEKHLDSHRVFVAGHSNGAFMALRLACETRGVYAGFVSVAGALAVDCPDPTPPSVVFWQGALDTTVPIAGGTFDGVTLPPLTTTLAPFTATCGSPVQSAADAGIASYVWTCAAGPRRLLLSSEGTHDWPDPPGQLIARAWKQLSAQRAGAGV